MCFVVYSTFIHVISQLAAVCTGLTEADVAITAKMVVTVVAMATRMVMLESKSATFKGARSFTMFPALLT